MDYRELPRIVAPDDPGEDDPPRPRRFPLSRPVRLDLRKVATVAMLALSLAAVLFYAGRHAIDSARAWLHAQPRYRLAFDRIELPEPPPDCFRGGTAAFLERYHRAQIARNRRITRWAKDKLAEIRASGRPGADVEELPEISLAEELHTLVFNSTYWTGYPNAEDPYIAPYLPWAGFQLVILNLEPTQ